jgi:hypothetical protein
VTVAFVATAGLQMEFKDIKTTEQRRIVKVLTALGWTRGRRTGAGRWFVPPKAGEGGW